MNLMTTEDYQLLGDPKYRAFVSQVEKALKGFEYTSEWADLISALSKLNKILASHKYTIVPKRMTVGKRLAQCMHPALPAGVHLKAIEVYETIFKLIGSEKLADELYVYSSGLFPLMANAASNVRPALLKIYEVYFLPLGKHLHSATTGLVLGVLPGLEEGSESYQWANDLLEQLSTAVGQEHFYSGLWTCALTSHSVRLPATTFALAHFDRKRSFDDQLHLMGAHIDTVVRALVECVQDSQVLVQRNALDFAVLAFPFHGSHIPKADQRQLLAAALNALLRRDMSLNRRLFTWVLGVADRSAGTDISGSCNEARSQDEGAALKMDYFNSHSRAVLVDVLNEILLASPSECAVADGHGQRRSAAVEQQMARPFRILISLLDKPEIGSSVLEDILVSVFRTLRASHDYLQDVTAQRPQEAGDQSFSGMCLSLRQVAEMLRARRLKASCSRVSSVASSSRRPSPAVSSSLHLQSKGAARAAHAEVVKAATLFFATLVPGFLWGFVGDLLCRLLRRGWLPQTLSHDAVSSSSAGRNLGFAEACKLVEVVLSVLCVEGSSCGKGTQSQRIPCLLSSLLKTLKEVAAVARMSQAQLQELLAALQLCTRLLAATHPAVAASASTTDGAGTAGAHAESDHSADLGRGPADSVDKRRELGTISQCAADYLDLFPIVVGCCCVDCSSPELLTYEGACDRNQAKVLCGGETSMQAEIIILACKLVVDFSSFPIYCSSAHKAALASIGRGNNFSDEDSDYPRWLLSLLMLIFRCEEFSVSSVAVCTFIDLVSLAGLAASQLSTAGARVDKLANGEVAPAKTGLDEATLCKALEPDRVYVMYWPALTPQLLHRVCESGDLYEHITNLIWNRIGAATNSQSLESTISCVILHHLLQAISDGGIVEDVIAAALVSPEKVHKAEAYEKLFAFWHCTRLLHQGSARTLERPLLIALMELTSGDETVRLLVRDWLMHVLEEDGNVARLMEPLLIALLHPDSARVEIRRLEVVPSYSTDYFHLSGPAGFTDERSASLFEEKRICAISHEGGSVKYHVMDVKTANQKFLQTSQPVVKSAVTAVDKDGVRTSKACVSHEDSFQYIRPESVKLHLNPFGSESSLDKLIFDGFQPHKPIRCGTSTWEERMVSASCPAIIDEKPSYDEIVARAKRLDSETCKREGITFGLEDEDDFDSYGCCSNTDIAGEAKAVVAGIIEEVLTLAFEASDYRTLPSSPFSHAVPAMPSVLSSRHGSEVSSADDAFGSYAGSTTSQIPHLASSPRHTTAGSRIESTSDTGKVVVEEAAGRGPIMYGLGGKPGYRPSEVAAAAMHGSERLPSSVHIALYSQPYDSNRVLCALACIKAMLTASPRLALHALASSRMNGVPRPELMHGLMLRHKRYMTNGAKFYNKIGSGDEAAAALLRHASLLEAVASLSLDYARSYYSTLEPQHEDGAVEVDGVRRHWPPAPRASAADIESNAAVQAAALDVLGLLFAQACGALPPDLTQYLSDLITREHVHWIVMSMAHSFVFWTNEHWARLGISLTQARQLMVHCKVVKLTSSLVAFEHYAAAQRSSDASVDLGVPTGARTMSSIPRRRLCERDAFLRCTSTALDGCSGAEHAWYIQLSWLQMVVGCLPHFGSSLPAVVAEVVPQLCSCLDTMFDDSWLPCHGSFEQGSNDSSTGPVVARPPGQVVRLLRLFAAMVHFTLVENSAQPTGVAASSETKSDGTTLGSMSISSSLSPADLISALDPMVVYTKEGDHQTGDGATSPAVMQNPMVAQLPRVISTMYRLWARRDQAEIGHLSEGQELQKQILDLLSLVALSCNKAFLHAMIMVWNDIRVTTPFFKKLSNEAMPVTTEQGMFIDLLMSIKVLPCDLLLECIWRLLKHGSVIGIDSDSKWSLHVGAFHMLLCYVLKSVMLTASNVSSFCTFVKESLQLSPPPVGVLLLLRLLSAVVQKLTAMPADAEKKILRELQDVTQKVVDSCCTIAASQLEPTAWLQTRKNYSVKIPSSRQLQSGAGASDSDEDCEAGTAVASASSSTLLLLLPPLAPAPDDIGGSSSDAVRVVIGGSLEQCSVAALAHLAEILASLLDVVYPSEDKEKAVPVLVSVFQHVFPYLRTHSTHNLPSYRACSQLLASVSGYGYTRRAWRRDAFELLLAPDFFQMDRKSLGHWRVLTDHLMTQDKQAFKDLLARLTLSGAAALPLFGGGVKDQEFELRSQYLKRLAFVIFCSDVDQYKQHLPEIQERLAECLRLPQVPSLQAQVFLCLRVLLVRMTSHHLTSLWPTIITELVQVLLQIEQELCGDIADANQRLSPVVNSAQLSRLVALDMSWAHGNGLHAHSNPAWLQLYVSGCRLLDLLCYLPDDAIPEFHHYLWMFVGSNDATERQNYDGSFVPHAMRIERHMRDMFGECTLMTAGQSRGLLMTDMAVTSLRDLHLVFAALTCQSQSQSRSYSSALAERYVESDFLEIIPQQ